MRVFFHFRSRERAWVTTLRRLRQKNELPKMQIDKLDAVGFEWNSTRECGSSFVKRYREVLSYLSQVVEAGGEVKELVYEDTEIMKWIDAQRQAYESGKLSESRAQYMDDLPGLIGGIPPVGGEKSLGEPGRLRES
jgi:hypothetical protein